jgi:Ca-activated chloride channel family protein
VVKHFINQVDLNSTVRLNGTAVGDGLLMAVQRLVQDPKRDQVVILATDGSSNTGQDPLLAAKIAAQAGIKVYTIGIGQKGGAPQMARSFGGKMVQVGRWEEPDEKTLGAIAAATGGRYYRAGDSRAMDAIYAEIADLERREVKVRSFREADEHYWPFLWWGALLLGIEALLRLRIRTVY